MADAATLAKDATANSSKMDPVWAAITPSVEKMRASFAKEGAELHVSIDEPRNTIVLSLERKRIVCEGCLLPEHLVRTMITNALRTNPEVAALRLNIETLNWILPS